MAFGFESMKVYREAVNWVEGIFQSLGELGDICPDSIRVRMESSALCLPPMIAEAVCESIPGHQQVLLRRGRAAVFQCVAQLHVMKRLGLLRESDAAAYLDHLAVVARILSSMICGEGGSPDMGPGLSAHEPRYIH